MKHLERIMMTLSAIAYKREHRGIRDLLEGKRGELATKGRWELVWGPHAKETNLAFLVKCKGSNEYALAIRGTVPLDPFSWLLDFEDKLVALPWESSPSDCRISYGMARVWHHLTTMPELTIRQPRLPEVLESLDPGSTVHVTGHSQGGAAASMMSLWMQDTYPELHVQMHSFAGETAGNEAFATALVRKAGPGYRYANHYDVVPRAFDQLASLPDLYGADIQLPEIVLEKWPKILKAFGATYRQPFEAIPVPKAAIYPPNPDPARRKPDREYLEEIAAQHSNIRYLWTLGAPYEPIDRKWRVPEHLPH